MWNGALNEEVTLDLLGCIEAVYPGLVFPGSVTDNVAGKVAHLRATTSKIGHAVQELHLLFQPGRGGYVVGVHSYQQLSLSSRDSGVECGDDAGSIDCARYYPLVARGPSVELGCGRISGAIVYRQDLEVSEGLTHQRIDSLVNGARCVVEWQEYRDVRSLAQGFLVGSVSDVAIRLSLTSILP